MKKWPSAASSGRSAQVRSGRSGIPGQSPLQALPQPSHLQEKAKKTFFLFLTQWHVRCSFPGKGSNPSSPHWKVDSLPLDHQGSTRKTCFKKLECELSFWLPSNIQKARGIVRLEIVTPNHSQRRHGEALPLLKVQKVYLFTLHKGKTSLLRTMIHSRAFP